MDTSSFSAALFLPFALPISIWVAWNDMKFMKIPNKAVMALAMSFLVVGLFALPFDTYLWRLLQLAVVLVIGFFLNMAGAFGAGDAKFAAAAAPYFALGDGRQILYLATGVLLAAVVTHRLAKHVKPLRNVTEDWESWTRKDFPMGFALGGILSFYLLLALFNGS